MAKATYVFTDDGVSASHPFMIGESYGDTSSPLVTGTELSGSVGVLSQSQFPRILRVNYFTSAPYIHPWYRNLILLMVVILEISVREHPMNLPWIRRIRDRVDSWGLGNRMNLLLDTTDTGSGGFLGIGESNEFALDTTDTGSGGFLGIGESNEFALDTTDTGSGGFLGIGESNEFALDTTDTGSGGFLGIGESNEFALDTTDTGSGGFLGNWGIE